MSICSSYDILSLISPNQTSHRSDIPNPPTAPHEGGILVESLLLALFGEGRRQASKEGASPATAANCSFQIHSRTSSDCSTPAKCGGLTDAISSRAGLSNFEYVSMNPDRMNRISPLRNSKPCDCAHFFRFASWIEYDSRTGYGRSCSWAHE